MNNPNAPQTSLQRTMSEIQVKLEIGEPDDKYEQQADAVADAVVASPLNSVQAMPMEKKEGMQMMMDEEEVQLLDGNKIQKQEQDETALEDPNNLSGVFREQIETGLISKIEADFKGRSPNQENIDEIVAFLKSSSDNSFIEVIDDKARCFQIKKLR